VLRTAFDTNDGVPVQVASAGAGFHLPWIDLRALPQAPRHAELVAIARDEARRPFDLVTGPLVRGVSLTLGEEELALLFSMHHIVSDAWSIGVLLRELETLYNAFSQREPSPLPELEIQYADYAQWQRSCLTAQLRAAEVAYWQERLLGLPSALELPTDRRRPPVQSFAGSVRSWRVDRALCGRLRSYGRQRGATLFMTLLAAFEVILARHSGQEDLALGTPVMGRGHEQLEGLIGFFVSTLVLRVDLAGSPGFGELLERSRETVLSAFAHQELPFEELVASLDPARDLARTPLFQVMLVLNPPLVAPKLAGLSIEQLSVGSETAKFDLTLVLGEREGAISGFAEYNRDLFDAATIDRLTGHLGALLDAVVEHFDQPIWTLPWLSAWERQQALHEGNDTAEDYGERRCLHELIAEQARRNPERVALEFEEAELSYGALTTRAKRLADFLRRLGVGPDTVVGIAMERSLEMVVGLLGILEAGGAYLPLDPSYPVERLEQMASDAFAGSRAPVVVTQAHLAPRFAEWSRRGWYVLRLDADWDALAGREIPGVPVLPDNLAYVIYTSGSTGRPKGAMNSHDAIRNRLLWMQSAYGLSTVDRVLQKTPFSFDVSVWEFFWPLLVGARLVLAPPERHRDSRYLVDLIAERQITTLHFVPSMLQLFVEEGGHHLCGSLQRVMASGEALPLELERTFTESSGAELYNLYGPTEAAVDVTAYACGCQVSGWTVSIGRPIGNLEIHLLAMDGSVVPVGVPGELHIGGMGLGRGYLGRPDLTAERFVPHPFGRGGERLYRTGDLARRRSSGQIDFLGRIDHQVKIRGFRIELGEIEAVLARHPAVREAFVVAIGQGTDAKLGAFVVPQAEGLSPALLREFLRTCLPELMVPAFIK